MAEHVYKKIEIVGSSPNGMEAAVHNALGRASKTIRNMRWFEVTETRGNLEDGKAEHCQVTLKIGFTLEEQCSAFVALAAQQSDRFNATAARLRVPAPIGTVWRH